MATAFVWWFRSGIYQNRSGVSSVRAYVFASIKNLVSLYPYSADFYVSNKIQSREYSTDGVAEEYGYERLIPRRERQLELRQRQVERERLES